MLWLILIVLCIPRWRHQMKTFSAFPRWPVNSTHKGQLRGTLMCSLICARIYGWVNNGEAGDLISHLAHYDVIAVHVWISVAVCCGLRDSRYILLQGLDSLSDKMYYRKISMPRNWNLKPLYCFGIGEASETSVKSIFQEDAAAVSSNQWFSNPYQK